MKKQIDIRLLTVDEKKELAVNYGLYGTVNREEKALLTWDWDEEDRILHWDTVAINKEYRVRLGKELLGFALELVRVLQPALMTADTQSRQGERLFKSFSDRVGINSIDFGKIERLAGVGGYDWQELNE